jgi:hypothetical protein
MQRLRQSRLFTQLGAVVATLVIIAAVAVVFGAVRTPIARAAPTCSVASLNGNYLGNFSGTSSSTGPFALQDLVIFNGNGTGNASLTLTSETSGGPISFTATFTYTLNSNCTGTLTALRSTGQTVHYDIVAVENATEVDFLQTDPGFVTTGVIKAQTTM